MVDVAYSRLLKTLLNLSTVQDAVQKQGAVEALLDAWSIVDAIHRLRELLQQMPHLKRSLSVNLFLRKTTTYKDLRNSIQHLRGDIAVMANKDMPVWGDLAWVTALDREGKTIRSCVLVSGTIRRGTHPILNPLEISTTGPVGSVTLIHNGHTVCLGDAVQFVAKITASLESALAKQIGNLPKTPPTSGADLLVTVDLAEVETSESSSAEGEEPR